MPLDRIHVFHGDTDVVPRGRITGGSRSVQKAIRDEVLRAQEFDGSWVDKTLLGRAYGTAMALNILEPEDQGPIIR